MADDGVLSISTSTVGDVVVVSPTGTIDMVTASEFQVFLDGVLTEVLTNPRPALVLDLTGVGFLGSVGIAAVTTPRGMPVAYAVAAGRISERPLRLIGIDTLISVFSTLNEALAAVS